jgi:hypothetical protein
MLAVGSWCDAYTVCTIYKLQNLIKSFPTPYRFLDNGMREYPIYIYIYIYKSPVFNITVQLSANMHRRYRQ